MNKTQLENYSIAQLQDEIDRQLTEKNKPIPSPLASYNPLPIEAICRDYIAFMASDDYHKDNDWKYYIYEVVLQTIYGDSVWEWIRIKMGVVKS